MTTFAVWTYLIYVITLVSAGAFGMLVPRADLRMLTRLDPNRLGSAISMASLLSQYRFLRAIELGFGTFALAYRHEIFTTQPFARFFFGAMLLGILGRVVSWIIDGRPYGAHLVFMFYEVFAIIV